MANIVYIATSLDGYIAAPGDDLGWSESCLWDGMFGLRVGASMAMNWERDGGQGRSAVNQVERWEEEAKHKLALETMYDDYLADQDN